MEGKVTVLINKLSGGGAERVCVTVVNSFINSGIEVELVVLSLKNAVYLDDISDKVKIIDLKVDSIKKSPIKIYKFLCDNSIDKVLVFSYELSLILLLLRRILNLNYKIISRCINTLSMEKKYESSFFRKYVIHNIIKLFYKKVDLVIAQSLGMENDLIINYNVNKSKIYTINNPLSNKIENISVYLDKEKFNLYKHEYILYIGRLSEQKGLKLLFEAFRNIENKNIKLMIVGQGEQKENLIKYCKYLKIEDRVIFERFSNNVELYYLNAKFTVLSSYFEGFPNVLIESIALGTPVVSFDCPSGPREIIQDGVNGYLVEYLNVKQLTRAMDKAINTNWDFNKIKKTSEKYYNSKIMKKYIDLIKNI